MVTVERVIGKSLDSEQVLNLIDAKRKSLSEAIRSSVISYQSCPSNPGLVEEIRPDGSRRLGRFENGFFIH